MARIKRADTKPERQLRSMLHRLGYRFRVQLRGVPGRPDIAFPARKVAIMVHGCFWHAHGCPEFRLPTTRPEFWQRKFDANKERDARLKAAAERAGWTCAVVWECELRNPTAVAEELVRLIGPPRLARHRRSVGIQTPTAPSSSRYGLSAGLRTGLG